MTCAAYATGYASALLLAWGVHTALVRPVAWLCTCNAVGLSLDTAEKTEQG